MSGVEFNTRLNQMTVMLNAFAYTLTKNVEDAKDLYQETAYRAIVNRDKFLPGTNFKAWLFTIMKNIFINNYRKKVKANTIFDATDNQFFINSSSTMVRNEGESNIMMEELNGMVDNLDHTIQQPFIMHYEGFKYQEIADELQLPLGTVKAGFSFARKELKNKINRRYDNLGKAWEKVSKFDNAYSQLEAQMN